LGSQVFTNLLISPRTLSAWLCPLAPVEPPHPHSQHQEVGEGAEPGEPGQEAVAGEEGGEVEAEAGGEQSLLNAPSILNINGTIDHSLLYVETRPPSFVGDE